MMAIVISRISAPSVLSPVSVPSRTAAIAVPVETDASPQEIFSRTSPQPQTQRPSSQAPTDSPKAEPKQETVSKPTEAPPTPMEAMLQKLSGNTAAPLPKFDAKSLAKGELDPKAAEIRAFVGHDVTAVGWGDFIASTVPGSHATSSLFLGDYGLFCSTSLRDGDGEAIGNFTHILKRHGKGLELEFANIWVEPTQRSQAVASRLLLNQTAMLRSLSDDPESCVSLNAGGASGGQFGRQNVGRYLWAKTGLFELGNTRGRPPEQEWNKLLDGYSKWVEGQTWSPAQKSQAHELGAAWKTPHDIATTDVKGLEAPLHLDGMPAEMAPLGKAFLMSSEASDWHGLSYVNRPLDDVAVSAQQAKVRQSDAALAARKQAWENSLATGDTASQKHTIAEIGRQGDTSWVPRLQMLGMHPELGQAARAAASSLQGEGLERKILNIALDEKRAPRVREAALDDFHTAGGQLTKEDAAKAIESPNLLKRVLQKAQKAGNAEVAVMAAHKILESTQIEPGMPFPGRSQLMDGIRVLHSSGQSKAIENFQTTDPLVGQMRDDLLAGRDVMPFGHYPDAARDPV